MLSRHPKHMRTSAVPFFLVFVLITASTSTLLASSTLPLEQQNEPFNAEENATTQLGWHENFGGGLFDYVTHSIMYPSGKVATAGWFQGNIEFGDEVDPVGARGGSEDVDFFLGWFDENGSWEAGISGGSSTTDSIDAIALLPNGDLIVAGTYCINSIGLLCQMGLGDLTPLRKNSQSDEGNAFIARIDANGEWVWASQVRNEKEIFVVDMLVTPENEIHLAVGFSGDLEISGSLYEASDDMSLLVAMFNENGNIISSFRADATGGVEPSGSLCIDGSGASYVTVTFVGELTFMETVLSSNGSTDVGVARYSEAGWSWAISAGSLGEERVYDCDGLPLAGVKIVGEFSGNATFGGQSTGQSDGIDLYVAEVSQDGGWVNIVTGGGVGIDRATGIAHNQQGSTYISGVTSAGMTLGQDIVPDLDGYDDQDHFDIFLAELLPNQTWGWAISVGGNGYDEPTSLEIGNDGSPFVSYIFNGNFTIGAQSTTAIGSFDVGMWLYQADRDNDGILDGEDNCPKTSNADQANYDADVQGDACDDDDDGDGVLDRNDDCKFGEKNWFSEPSTDHDGDGCNDESEDFDDDEDTVFDHNDLCPLGPVGWISTPEEDSEGDGCADIDTDEDEWVDQMDNCPFIPNPSQADLDNDRIGDVCDIDEDGDKIANPSDNCPRDSPLWTSTFINDHDQDGCHDSITDFDDDQDGVEDSKDRCPVGDTGWGSTAVIDDYDGDGCRDVSEDDDDDDDGVNDLVDNCPTGILGVAGQGQDIDGDGCIDSDEDVDDDEDGVLDTNDLCSRTVAGQQVSITGCSQYQLDDDLDGIPNAIDLCQNTVPGRIVDLAGCEVDLGGTTDDGASSNDGLTLSNVLYIFAAVCVTGAVYITFFNNPNSSKKPKQTPSISVQPVSQTARMTASDTEGQEE